MRLKGKTTFELTDVNTGAVEIFEDSNMITNGMSNFWNPFGVFGNYPANDGNINEVQPLNWLTGGLMLFGNQLTAEANNTLMPAGNVMVGNGAKDIANNGQVTNMGSYNSAESSVSTEGNRVTVKYVYDFTTAQGNGKIACACLTTKAGGYIGMGNATSRLTDQNFHMETYQSGCYGNSKKPALIFNNYSYAPYNCFGYPVYNEDAVYVVDPQTVYYASSSYADQRANHWSTTGKIKVHKMRAGFKSVGLVDGGSISHIKQTWEVTVPTAIRTYMGSTKYYTNVFSDALTRSIYITFVKDNTNISSASNFYVMKIDSNMTATAYQVTNNTGSSLYIGDNSDRSGYRRIAFDGDYMYCWGYINNEYKLFGIKYADSTQVVETPVVNSSADAIYKLASNLIAIDGGFKSSYDYYNAKIYDAVNDTIKYTNGYGTQIKRLTPFADKSGIYLVEDLLSNDVVYEIRKDPRFLATINNLTEAVQKTAEKTMKVIYTLTYEV